MHTFSFDFLTSIKQMQQRTLLSLIGLDKLVCLKQFSTFTKHLSEVQDNVDSTYSQFKNTLQLHCNR